MFKFFKFDEFLAERNIGKLQKNITIKVEIDSTVHSDERKFRHDDKQITDSDIIRTADKAIPEITDQLLFDKIDIGDAIHIKDSKTDLNLIAQLQGSGSKIKLVIITVMIKKNFVPKKGTKSNTI